MFGNIDAQMSASAANSMRHKRGLLQASSSGSATGSDSAASSAASALGSMGSTLSGLFNHDWANEFSPDALKNLSKIPVLCSNILFHLNQQIFSQLTADEFE